jgi:hypothetical protein
MYKDQWSAAQNGMYCAAACFLAKKKHESKPGGGKLQASPHDKNVGAYLVLCRH